MSAGAAILVLLLTTAVSTLIAGYYYHRFCSVQRSLFRSDAIATARANEIQRLQVKIEMMKPRGKKVLAG